jgi:hypothetical protein
MPNGIVIARQKEEFVLPTIETSYAGVVFDEQGIAVFWGRSEKIGLDIGFGGQAEKELVARLLCTAPLKLGMSEADQQHLHLSPR